MDALAALPIPPMEFFQAIQPGELPRRRDRDFVPSAAPSIFRTGEACTVSIEVSTEDMCKQLRECRGITTCCVLDAHPSLRRFEKDGLIFVIAYHGTHPEVPLKWIGSMSAARLENCGTGLLRKILNMTPDRQVKSIGGFNELSLDDQTKLLKRFDDQTNDYPPEYRTGGGFSGVALRALWPLERIEKYIIEPDVKLAAMEALTYEGAMAPYNYHRNTLDQIPPLPPKDRTHNVLELLSSGAILNAAADDDDDGDDGRKAGAETPQKQTPQKKAPKKRKQQPATETALTPSKADVEFPTSTDEARPRRRAAQKSMAATQQLFTEPDKRDSLAHGSDEPMAVGSRLSPVTEEGEGEDAEEEEGEEAEEGDYMQWDDPDADGDEDEDEDEEEWGRPDDAEGDGDVEFMMAEA